MKYSGINFIRTSSIAFLFTSYEICISTAFLPSCLLFDLFKKFFNFLIINFYFATPRMEQELYFSYSSSMENCPCCLLFQNLIEDYPLLYITFLYNADLLKERLDIYLHSRLKYL